MVASVAAGAAGNGRKTPLGQEFIMNNKILKPTFLAYYSRYFFNILLVVFIFRAFFYRKLFNPFRLYGANYFCRKFCYYQQELLRY